MGIRRVADNGNVAHSSARTVLGNFAARVRFRLSLGGDCLLDRVSAVGAICGGTVVGHLSQKWGRRRSIALCCALGIVLIPLWVFSPGYTLLVIGGFAMQFMVQGAWGIVPVHLNELSPDAVRGTFPGFAYQLGNLFAANTAVAEARLADHFHNTG